MARIYAKFNSGSEAWDPLDPNNWIGEQVPGPGDIAQFHRYKQAGGNSTYENNYNYMSQTVEYDSNSSNNITIFPSNLDSTGSFSPIWYTGDYTRNFIGFHMSGSPELLGSNMPYGAVGDGAYYHGYYYSQNSSQNFHTSRSYNRTTENNWKYRYKDGMYVYNSYGPWYYRHYARSYYIYYNNRTNTQFTVDGVTIGPETDNTTYYWGWRRWDQTREQAALEGTHSMADRMVDLFTGSALHVSNGGRWNIVGPHNGTGNSADDGNRNIRRQFTIYCESAESESYTPSYGSVNSSAHNMTSYDMSRYIRVAKIFALTRSAAVAEEFPGVVYEGTSSIKYGTSFTSSDNGYGNYYLSGSGHLYIRDYLGADMGAGPGNYGQIKMEFKDPQLNYIQNANFFTSHGKWINSQSVSVPASPNNDMINLNTGHLSNQPISYNAQYYTDSMLQKWELTGSQHWQVGRIEMASYTHFHVKDDARITLIDMEDSNYPTIDMQDYERYPTLILSDQASIYLSSSRSSEISTTEAGIYQYDNYTSVIISGSANYSSSKLSNSASAEDTSIEIDSLQSNFGIGDYISIESTGSLILTADQFGSSTYNSIASDQTPIIDTGSEATYWSGSNAQLRERHGYVSTYNGVQNPSSGSTFLNSNRPDFAVSKLYTHTFENDELVQIESMSGDFATISKMYGKRGEIQSDMGLYSFDQFTETFGESPSTNYSGTKRVVLVDSNHRNFKAGDKLVISGSKVCTVLYATTYLSQSHYYDFTSSNSPALDQVFDLEPKSYSGSSIFTTNTGTYGVTAPSTYYAEMMFKWRLLITGSFQGSNSVPFPHISNAGSNTRYGGSSGSFNDYVALKLDPTLAYNWRQPYYSANNYYASSSIGAGIIAKNVTTADYHTVYSTNYLYGWYQLKDTHNFVEGEITVSGSLLRDGRWDPTSSVSTYTQNGFGFRIADLPWTGVHKHGDDEASYGRNATYMYMSPYPYGQGVIANSYPSVGVHVMSNYYGNWIPLTSKGRHMDYPAYNKPGQPYRYYYRPAGKAITDDPTFKATGMNFDAAALYYTASWSNMTGSQHLDLTGSNVGVTYPDSTFAIRSKIQNGLNHVFVVKGEDEFKVEQVMSNHGRGRISLYLNMYASIHSVNVKTRWQQLILDTQESFNYRDFIKEGGLLSTHYPNKDVKFIATEVVDAKGFKNLLWDWEYTKGETSIKPYIFANCLYGTYAGSTSMTYGYTDIAEWSGCDLPLLPGCHTGNRYYTKGQANDNFYIIYDLRTQVTFDTIGMVFHRGYGSVAHEYQVDNQMNNVEFQVCDDVGVANPAWETVRVKSNDIRRSSGQGNIRFYTFPSGSVTKRYVKYHSRGGTKNSNYYHHSVFGLYNFSGSCAASNTLDADSVAGGFAEQIGGFSAGPTGSMWQVELANVKNFKIGDHIFFWSKQMGDYNSLGNPQSNYYDNYNSVTNTRNGTLPENEKLGGFGQTHRIVDINGNIVTLHKPITRRHIGKGTIAYKFNRGNVTISGSRNTPFRLFGYNTANTRTIQNATFFNGFSYKYNGYEYGGINSIQDAGFDTYHAGYNNGGVYPGIYKNIVSPGTGFRMNAYRNGLNKQTQTQYFNILQFGYGTNYGLSDSFYLGTNKVVVNFCTAGAYGAQYATRLFDQYGHGTVGNVQGKFILKNSYMPESLYLDLSLTKGLGIRYQGTQMSNLSSLIDVDNIVIAGGEGNQARWYDRTWSQTSWQGNDRSHSTTNVLRYNDWFFPFHTNRRGRKSQYSPSSNRTGLDYTTLYVPFGKMGVPNLQKGNADDFVAPNKDYLYTYLSAYAGIATMKSDDFNTSGFYEHYLLMQGDYKKANQTDRTHHIYSCNFNVLEETQVRLDLNMIYKNTAANIYGVGGSSYATNRSYNYYGSNHPCIMLQKIMDPNDPDKNNRVEQVFYLDQLQGTIDYNKIVNVTPGQYQFVLHPRSYHYTYFNYIISFKDLEFRLVTPDLSKIEILYNNWDMHRVLNQPDHYESQAGFPATQNFGMHRVLKQSSDLSTNYKFNKIKL